MLIRLIFIIRSIVFNVFIVLFFLWIGDILSYTFLDISLTKKFAEWLKKKLNIKNKKSDPK